MIQNPRNELPEETQGRHDEHHEILDYLRLQTEFAREYSTDRAEFLEQIADAIAGGWHRR